MFKKVVFPALLIATMLLGLVGCASQPAATPAPAQPTAGEAPAGKAFRVAMIFPGAVNDKSFNESGYNGLNRIKSELGAEIAFQEKVASSDWEESMRTFASQGYDLVIGHGDQFSEASKVVAAEFPKVKFMVVNGANSAENLASISLFDEQVAYLAGAAAAKASKSGKVGYIGGLEIPPVVRNGKGFEAGAKSVNPNIEVSSTYLGSFTDAAKGKETTLAMADKGVDVIYYYVDQAMLGIQEAAKAKQIKLVGCIFDQHELAPDLIITSAINDISTAIFLAAKDAKDGKFEGKIMLFGLDTGAIDLAPFYDSVPKDVEESVKQIKADIIAGKVTVERIKQ